jgi:hypothetical protein
MAIDVPRQTAGNSSRREDSSHDLNSRFVDLWEMQRSGKCVCRDLDWLYLDMRERRGMGMADGNGPMQHICGRAS